jgi:hypothetical protein
VLAQSTAAIADGVQADNGKRPRYQNFTSTFGDCAGTFAGTDSGAEGFVIVHHEAGVLELNVHLKDAVPNVIYTIDYTCHQILGIIATNSNGVGKGVFDVTPAAGATTFVFEAHAGVFVGGPGNGASTTC